MIAVMITGIYIGVLGLLCGSFINALVWRVHEQAEVADARKKITPPARRATAAKTTLSAAHKTSTDLSIMRGRSMCPRCRHVLVVKDLVPILSWVSLRGKCRYCRAPISVQYPGVELLTASLFWLCYTVWPQPFTTIGISMLAVFLGIMILYIALAVYDSKWFLLPNRLVRPLTILAGIYAVLSVVAHTQHSWLFTLATTVLGVGILYGLFWGLHAYSNGEWIGGGDVTISLALGLIAGGIWQVLLVIFIASLLGTVGSIPLLLKGKRTLKHQIPFGPYLLLASVVVVLFGRYMADWYLSVAT
jgi:leader peptidase (prepilin peptidase)/N-methyltransferase